MSEIEARTDAQGRPVTGRWFEELTEGLVIPHALRRTLTEADNVGLPTLAKMYPYDPHASPSRHLLPDL